MSPAKASSKSLDASGSADLAVDNSLVMQLTAAASTQTLGGRVEHPVQSSNIDINTREDPNEKKFRSCSIDSGRSVFDNLKIEAVSSSFHNRRRPTEMGLERHR